MIQKKTLASTITTTLLMTAVFSSNGYAMNLKETIEDAILHNPEFRAEVKKYRGIEAEVRGARGSYYPTLDLNAGIGYEEVDNQTTVNTGKGLTRQETSVKLTQNLFEGFGTSNEVDRQKFRLDAQAYKAEAKASDIALSMTEAYIDLLKQQDLLSLAQDNLDTHLKIMDQITKRNSAGIGNQVEVDQANARLSLAQANFASTQNNYYDALAKFRRVLGRDPDSDLVKPKFAFQLPKNLDDATNTAMTDHPTLRSANGDVAEARKQFESSSKTFYPRLDLEIEKTFDNNLGGVEGKNEDLQAMLRMKYNLYNGGKDSANRQRTESAYLEATEIRNNTRRQLIENLRYAWNAQVYVSDQIKYTTQHIKLTHDTLNGYRKQFSLGRRSLLDLLNTENEYNSALRTLMSSEADLLKAKYRILGGMGHLLTKLNIQYSFIDPKDHPTE
ncbi:TolC family outer membrane protein [Thiosulfativibrio zosterae]|uniref:Channel protein TolC n=1 Tax=Thiosulfativibrio zosterae TaxID=2675053 RepID=A0A6F8PQ62_9GAMM|nr:TolC family outer membrane protein [Thiosulfativibrio zosterae]BBP44245.1 channel protein TolC [Thiosulfativibrio zosterae]